MTAARPSWASDAGGTKTVAGADAQPPATMTDDELAAAGWDLDNPFGGDPDYVPELLGPLARDLEAAGQLGRVAAIDARVRTGRRAFHRAGGDLARAAYALMRAADRARYTEPPGVAPGGELAYAAEGLARMAGTGEGVEPGVIAAAANRCRRLARELVDDPGIDTPVDVELQAAKVRRLAGDVECAVDDVAALLHDRGALMAAVPLT